MAIRSISSAWDSILSRIENSRFFIVLFSKASVESRGVIEEISQAHYCSLNLPNTLPTIIPLIIEDGVTVPRKIVRFVRLPFRATQYDGDFGLLLKSLGIEESPFRSTSELDVTFSRGREFNVEREAGICAFSLISNNAEVSARFDTLSEEVRREAGGRWKLFGGRKFGETQFGLIT